MGFQRAISIGAMRAVSSSNDFMTTDAKLALPQPPVAGALPAMTRELNSASQLRMFMDLVILWGIGDFGAAYQCSAYYDPSSPWYNAFYGAYAIRSYKKDGTAWGYNAQGQADFDEFLQVPAVDYNFLTAAQFGCPPSMMCFKVKSVHSIPASPPDNSWDFADVRAQVPSGLHDPTQHAANPGNYIVFGIPDPSFLKDHTSYEPVQVHAQFYMRRLSVPSGSPPITLVFGAICPDPTGGTQLTAIMQTLKQAYWKLGG